MRSCGRLFRAADREIAALELFAALAGSAPRQRHVFRLRAAASGLPREDVDFAIGLAHAAGTLSLLQIRLRGTQFIRRISLSPGITRTVNRLARAQQRRG